MITPTMLAHPVSTVLGTRTFYKKRPTESLHVPELETARTTKVRNHSEMRRDKHILHTMTAKDAVKHLTMRTSEWSTCISDDHDTAR
jgi:hypothetical protein